MPTAVATMAAVSTTPTAASVTTTMASTASAPRTTAAARATISAAVTTTVAAAGWRVYAIEVRLIALLEFRAAFERQRSSDGYAIRLNLRCSGHFTGRSRSASTHFCPLLFQNRLA
jgi:hypothetical protein